MKNVRNTIICNSLYSIICGVGIDVVAPILNSDASMFTLLLKAGGVIGIAYYSLTLSKFTKVFECLGLGVGSVYPIQKGKSRTESSTIYKFTLPCGLSVKEFDEKKDAIEAYLGRKIDIRYTYKEILIEVYDQNIKTFYEYEPIKLKGNVPLVIGYDRQGNLISCDLSNGEPHMLIAGETGSGKSTIIRAIISNLILMSSVKLHLIDLKMGAEFNVFSKSNKVISFGRTINDAFEILSSINDEVDRRYSLFFKNDVKDIDEYNKKFKYKKLDYEVLIIDEYADLQSEKESMRLIENLGRKSRACGIHLILATQRPDHKVLTGAIKANIGTVLGLKTLNSTNSGIILDRTGLEKLRGKGHGLFKRGDVTEIQAPFVSTDKVKELIKHTYIKKKNNEDKPAVNGNLNEYDLQEVFSRL